MVFGKTDFAKNNLGKLLVGKMDLTKLPGIILKSLIAERNNCHYCDGLFEALQMMFRGGGKNLIKVSNLGLAHSEEEIDSHEFFGKEKNNSVWTKIARKVN